MKIAGAIIAGGKSSRMGGLEKTFLSWDGQSILDRIVARLSPQVDALIVNANGDPARFGGLTVVPDREAGTPTPLAGLLAVLTWGAGQGFDAVLTVPSDTPFLPRDMAEWLSGNGPAIASAAGQDHYLTGLWPSALAPELDRCFASGLIRVQDWARQVKARRVVWPDQPYDPFFNVNTPEDLAEAQRISPLVS